MTSSDFKNEILQGIPDTLPEKKAFDATANHAPKRKDILSRAEKNSWYEMLAQKLTRTPLRSFAFAQKNQKACSK